MARNIKNIQCLESLTAYKVISHENLDDIDSFGIVLQHKQSGARVAVISNDDSNKVFNIGFRTPPKDSTGVAHIIEHTVLCGSKAFPAKDPFIELTKGTLNTFLNAMTYPDKTLYPVASYNDTDFQNLCHVYLDAVFYPNIYTKREIFEQEGWHYELKDKEDELKYNGVVYNEMKGVYSNPESLIHRNVKSALFPDTCYGVDSGGNPDEIPDLTYEDYLEFHRKYYHPSNCYVYLYGDMDVVEKLEFMDREYFSKFHAIQVDSRIQNQKPFDKIRQYEKKYSIAETDSEENKTYLTMAYSIGDCLDQELCITLSIMEYVLFSAPGAPVKQALLDANIGNDVTSSEDSQTKYPYLAVTLKNSDRKHMHKFQEVLETKLCEIVENGIDEKSLKAAINLYEFQYREADFGQFPKGLMYSLSMYATWMNSEEDVFSALREDKIYEELKKRVGTSYFTDFIKKYLLENKHVSLIILEPEAGLNYRKEKALSQQLQEKKRQMSEEEVEKLIEDTKNLLKYQSEPSTPEELRMIPILSRNDIDKKAKPFSNEESMMDGVKVLHHNYSTNGIIYLKFLFALDKVPKEYINYIGLLNTVIGYIDLQHRTYLDFTNDVNIVTGGMNTSILTFGKKGNSKDFNAYLSINCKVLSENLDKCLALTKEMMYESKLDDTKRLQEILFEIKSRIAVRLVSNGHTSAADRAFSYQSEEACFEQETRGISYYNFIKGLVDEFDTRKDEIGKNLIELIALIFNKENLLVSITCNEKNFNLVKNELPQFISSLHDTRCEKQQIEYNLERKNEGFKTSSQVQYVACVGNIFNAGYNYHGSMKVLRTILGYDYLWNNVRVQGGAYGCMCSFSGTDGNCYFTSYRDPNLVNTLDVYKRIPEFIKNFDADDREMDKYVIGTMSGIDTPLTPASKGTRSLNAYMIGATLEDIQKERDDVLAVTVDDIRKLSDVIASIVNADYLCVIGNDKKIEENKDVFLTTKEL